MLTRGQRRRRRDVVRLQSQESQADSVESNLSSPSARSSRTTTPSLDSNSTTGCTQRVVQPSPLDTADVVANKCADDHPMDEDDDIRLLYEWIYHDNASFHTNYVKSTLQDQSRQKAQLQESQDTSPSQDMGLGQTLLDWYSRHRRRLPWRGDDPPWTNASTKVKPKAHAKRRKRHQRQEEDQDRRYAAPTTASPLLTPYSVWVSETMLQQTRVETVIDYWTRWMETFPTLGHLAEADPDQVNAAWAGLGYYARAQRFHQAAQYCYQQQRSRLQESSGQQEPKHVKSPIYWTKEDWQELPGIGPYTAGALASRIGGQAAPAVDGNVARVMARLGGVAQSIQSPMLLHQWAPAAVQIILNSHSSSPATLSCRDEAIESNALSRFTDFDQVFVSEDTIHRPVAGEINQALMELGATLCRPTGTGFDSEDPWKDCYMSARIGRAVRKLLTTRQGQARLNKLISVCQERATVREVQAKVDSRPATKKGRKAIEKTPTPYCSVCAPNGVPQILHTVVSSLKEVQESASSEFQLEWDDQGSSCGHQAFPLPPVKGCKREEVYAVAVLSYGDPSDDPFWLLTKRPDKGLLAGQWEFPSKCVWNSEESLPNGAEAQPLRKRSRNSTVQEVPTICEKARRKAIKQILEDVVIPSGQVESLERLERAFELATKTPIQHVFSHIRHTLWIEEAHIGTNSKEQNQDFPAHDWIDGRGRPVRWMRLEQMREVGVTAGVTKILRSVEASRDARCQKQSSAS